MRGIAIIANVERNNDLKLRLVGKTLSPKEFISMDPKDMASKETKEHREKIEKESFESYLLF